MSKYKNKKATRKHNGEDVAFDSQAEAARFTLLALLEKSGEISGLELQPKFQLCEPFSRNGKHHRAIIYIADFRYQQNGKTIVEDVKGMKTALYMLKKKLFLRRYGESLRFIEVQLKRTRFIETEV